MAARKLSFVAEQLLARFTTEVSGKSRAIDPEDEYDWESLAYGFFLGHGATPAGARRLVLAALQRNLL
jgi:hypothetical protein